MANPPTPEQRAEHLAVIQSERGKIVPWDQAIGDRDWLLAEVDRITDEIRAEREDHNRAKDGWERAAGELRDADERAEKAEQLARAYQQTLEERTRERDEAKAQLAALRPEQGTAWIVAGLTGCEGPDAIEVSVPTVVVNHVGGVAKEETGHATLVVLRSALVQFPPAPAAAEGPSPEQAKLLRKVAQCADHLTDLMAEFPNQPSAFSEYVEALDGALDRLKKTGWQRLDPPPAQEPRGGGETR